MHAFGHQDVGAYLLYKDSVEEDDIFVDVFNINLCGCLRSIIVNRIGSDPNLKYGSKQKLAAFTHP